MRVPAILAAAGMAVLGTYYFHNKRTHKTAALICKALATALPGVLMRRMCSWSVSLSWELPASAQVISV